MTDQITRTPYAHKIRYGITGTPVLTQDEMDGSHAPGIGVAPALVELVYNAPRDGKPASVSASVTGWWTRFGERADGQVTVHFADGPGGWPAWLAAEARLHDPDAAVSAGRAPAADRAALHDRIAALFRHPPGGERLGDATPGEIADAVLDVLPATDNQAAEIERLRERHMASLRRADQINNELMEEVQRYAAGTERPVLWSVYNRMHQRALEAEAEANRLRRMAGEAPHTGEQT
jgi:hypothetical protein